MAILRGPMFFVLLFGGFLLAVSTPWIGLRATGWLYAIVPVLAVWVLWLMRVYQRWGRLGERSW